MNETWWVDEADLDDDQRAIIDLPAGGSHLIVGPPGSGKTNLLVLRANYLYAKGHANIVLLTFNRSLRDFIAFGGAQYLFPQDKVITATKFLHGLLAEFGQHENLPDGFAAMRAEMASRVIALIESRQLGKYVDVILLDEGQDYTQNEILIFQSIANDVYVVADSRQMIYDGTDPLEFLRESIGAEHELKYHYRCGIAICRVADGIAKHKGEHRSLSESCNYNEKARPSSVRVETNESLENAAKMMITGLVSQLKTYPDELLGVLCPLGIDVDVVAAILESSELGTKCVRLNETGGVQFDSEKPICVGTIHSAKGLEFRAVHVAGTEGFKKFGRNRNMCFTAVTRAKTSLTVYPKQLFARLPRGRPSREF